MSDSFAANRYRRLLLAADEGNARAMRELGVACAHGNGTPLDLVSAGMWFQAASLHGDVKAQHYLASCYDLGLGVPMDPVTAKYWRKRAAAAESMESLKSLQLTEQDGQLPWSRPAPLVAECVEDVIAIIEEQNASLETGNTDQPDDGTYYIGMFLHYLDDDAAAGTFPDSQPPHYLQRQTFDGVEKPKASASELAPVLSFVNHQLDVMVADTDAQLDHLLQFEAQENTFSFANQSIVSVTFPARRAVVAALETASPKLDILVESDMGVFALSFPIPIKLVPMSTTAVESSDSTVSRTALIDALTNVRQEDARVSGLGSRCLSMLIGFVADALLRYRLKELFY